MFLKEEDKQNQTLLLKFERKMISQCKYIALSSIHLGEEFIYFYFQLAFAVWPSVCSVPEFIKLNVPMNRLGYCYSTDSHSVILESAFLTSSQVRPTLSSTGITH